MSPHKLSVPLVENKPIPGWVSDSLSMGSSNYEQRLSAEKEWALVEASRHFDEQSDVFKTLKKIARQFEAMQVSYAIVGGMALFQHGLRRFTEDVDILVTKSELKRIHEKLDGLGYLPPHQHSKHLRDTETGVRIEFLTSGEYPGDGKPKPVAFPDPAQVSTEISGARYITLPKLIELKLASGMSSPNRRKDLADVQELIKILELPRSYAGQLESSVQSTFDQLWSEGQQRYVRLWRNKWLTAEATNLKEMADQLQAAADQLKEMLLAGVVLEPGENVGDDYAMLVTTDPEVARKYDMIEESEFWPDAESQ